VLYLRTRPIEVDSVVVGESEVIRSVMGTGTLEARVQTTISPKISGRIAEVFVDQGDMVESGDVLVKLDDADLLQQARIAKTSITTAEASLGRFQAELAQAKSKLTKASADLERAQQLGNTISRADLEVATEGFDVAVSGKAKAEANLLEAEQQVELAKASLAFDEARLADATLTAPFSGLIIDRLRDPGSVAVPGTPILQLISLEELWISAWVDETEMDELSDGQPARVLFRSQPKVEFEGQVARLGKLADRETREFTVDVRILELPEQWAIGQRAEVYIETARLEAGLSVEADFLSHRDGQVGVYVDRGGTARWQPVQVGIEGRDKVEVVEGLRANDVVLKPRRPTIQSLDGRFVSHAAKAAPE
jgi:HlyD family secretion protein